MIQKDVFFNRHGGNQAQFLKDHTDSTVFGIFRVMDRLYFSIDSDLAAVTAVNTGHDLHQSGFSCSVSSYQRMNFPFLQPEINIFENRNSAKAFADISHQNRVFCHFLLLITAGCFAASRKIVLPFFTRCQIRPLLILPRYSRSKHLRFLQQVPC